MRVRTHAHTHTHTHTHTPCLHTTYQGHVVLYNKRKQKLYIEVTLVDCTLSSGQQGLQHSLSIIDNVHTTAPCCSEISFTLSDNVCAALDLQAF